MEEAEAFLMRLPARIRTAQFVELYWSTIEQVHRHQAVFDELARQSVRKISFPFVPLHLPETSIRRMNRRDAVVIAKEKIRVLYMHSIGTTGPSELEQHLRGWIFEEEPSRGNVFTRAKLVRAIAARYKRIYEEEAATTTIAADFLPHSYNRNRTNGKYGIWGHFLYDLELTGVMFDPENNLYRLMIDC